MATYAELCRDTQDFPERDDRNSEVRRHHSIALHRLSVILLALLVCPVAGVSAENDQHRSLVAIDRGELALSDVWAMGGDPLGVVDDHVYVLLSDSARNDLDANEVDYAVVYEDINQTYRAYRKRLKAQRTEPFTDYHDLASADAALQQIATEHADIAALEVIGYSLEGRPIHALRISDDASVVDPTEPGMVIVGCHHAREWISVEVPLFFAEYLVDNYLRNGDVTRLVNNTEIWIVPVLNPDGLEYTQTNRFWRKNRRDNLDDTFGVDLNRNYTIGFGDDAGSGSATSSQNYRGLEPFSEPEAQAMRDLMAGSSGRTFDVSLSYHSFGQLVLYPNNHTVEAVENVAYYDEIASTMAQLINEGHSDESFDYAYGQSSQTLYIASGTFTDWVHTALGATAIIIELRPKGSPFFELPPTEIVSTCQENLPAFLYFAEQGMIPEARSLDADADGFLSEDDYCPDTPAGLPVDRIGCAETEQDLDDDGIANQDDACRDTPATQQVGLDGCRAEATVVLRITSNATPAAIEVAPSDIDGAGAGDADDIGFVREYAEQTVITLTAPDTVGDLRFLRWMIDDQPRELGNPTVLIDGLGAVDAKAVYAMARAHTACGVLGLANLFIIIGGVVALRIAHRPKSTPLKP